MSGKCYMAVRTCYNDNGFTENYHNGKCCCFNAQKLFNPMKKELTNENAKQQNHNKVNNMQNTLQYDRTVTTLSKRPSFVTHIKVEYKNKTKMIGIVGKRILVAKHIQDDIITGVEIHLIEKSGNIEAINVETILFDKLCSIAYV